MDVSISSDNSSADGSSINNGSIDWSSSNSGSTGGSISYNSGSTTGPMTTSIFSLYSNASSSNSLKGSKNTSSNGSDILTWHEMGTMP